MKAPAPARTSILDPNQDPNGGRAGAGLPERNTTMDWPHWIMTVVGVVLLLVSGGIFALVGWATLKARELDDPDHPYKGPP